MVFSERGQRKGGWGGGGEWREDRAAYGMLGVGRGDFQLCLQERVEWT